MTQTFACDPLNYDYYIDPKTGDLAILSGANAVGQDCVTAMRAQRNEMQYAMDKGMPTRATVFNGYNKPTFEAAARKVIKGVSGVVGITAFSVSVASNKLSYAATIETVYGTTYING